jgi:methionine sulfoxide reductase heme-binding subunit
MDASTRRRLGKVLLFAASLVPLALVGADALGGRLGANPIETILNRFGFWTLTFVMLALVPTPLQSLFGWKWLAPYRRMVGLFAFFYGFLHLATYVGVDQFFDWKAIAADVVKRKFITIGMLAFALLVPLALTSTNAAVRRLGYVRWKRLHRLVYLAAVCGVVHFVWRVKADLREPLIFAAVLTLLLGLRVATYRRARRLRASVEGRANEPRRGSPVAS